MRDIREKNWFWLENDLVDREDITAMEKLIYMLLARYADKDGKCFPSQDKLCKVTGIKDYRTIVKYLRQLEEKGLIEIQKTNGKVNVYYLKNVEKAPTKNVGTKNAGTNFADEPPTKNVGTPPTNFAGITIHNEKDTKNNTQLKEKYKKEKSEVVEYIENQNLSSEYKNKLLEFLEYRKKMKKPIKTVRAINCILNEFKNTGEQHAISCIDFAIDREYIGVRADYIKINKTPNATQDIKWGD